MSTEGHTESMQAAIPRERLHRIPDDGGYLPREQATVLRQSCTGGSCRQGRRKCETPEACYTPIDGDDDLGDTANAIVIAASLAVALLALACAVLPMIFNR